MWVSTSREVQPFGADHDPEHDLQHDSGQDDSAMEPRQDRPGARRGQDEDERAGVRQRRLRRQQDESDHVRRTVGAIPHVLVNEPPGSRRISDSPVRNAFGGHVIGSTARLRRSTSGSGSPVKSIRYG